MSRQVRRGFTLIELMVVVAIIGMLTAIAVPELMRMADDAKREKVKADFSGVGEALNLYRLHGGSYPRELRLLWEQPEPARGWRGPYFSPEKAPPTDPYGTPYEYRYISAQSYELISYGPDQAPGGDDISSRALLQPQ